MKIYNKTLLIILIGFILTPIFVFAQSAEEEAINKEIEARKQKIEELEKAIDQYNKSITQKRTEAVSLKNQLQILDNHSVQLQAEIDLAREKISETQLQIDSLQLGIKAKEETIRKQKQIIVTLIQHLNAEGEKKYIEILLTNKSFADFFDQVKYLEKTYIELGKSVKALRLAKEDLDNKKKQMEAKKADLLALKEDLDNKKKDFQDQSYTKQNLLAQTQSSELKYRTLLNSLRQQQLAIESELKNYEEQARRRLAQQNKIEEGGVALSWPAPSRYITSGFRDPDYPYRNIFEHNAIDIRAGQGTPIVAAASGYIGRATHCTTASCYNYVLIIHNGNFSTVYGHLSNVLVTTDKFVNRGDVIGYSGGTPGTVGAGPFVTGPHLHFEVRLNGIPVNPIGYLIQ